MLNKEQIEEILPHRDPFLLIDEITELVPGVSAKGIKNVREDEYYFKGHFPGMPIMPGVLILEAMAQTGAVAMLCLPENKGKLGLFAGADQIKWKKQVKPGDQLVFEVSIVKTLGPIGIGEAKAFLRGELCCTATIKFAIQ